MQSKQVEGIIYIGAHCREIKSIPKGLKCPLVVAYGFAGDREIPSVVFDDEQAAYEATLELIREGHKRIGVISGDKDSLHTFSRMVGHQKALYENRILYNPALNVTGNWLRSMGYEACRQLLREDVTAIFAMSDVMALGVYDYANDHGVEIGKDIALIGIDDRQFSTAFKPALTTMALPLHEIGKKAAEIVVEQVEGSMAGEWSTPIKSNVC